MPLPRLSNRSINEYFEKKQISQILETIVAGLSVNQPEDPLTYIEECIEKIRIDARDNKIEWDMLISNKLQRKKAHQTTGKLPKIPQAAESARSTQAAGAPAGVNDKTSTSLGSKEPMVEGSKDRVNATASPQQLSNERTASPQQRNGGSAQVKASKLPPISRRSVVEGSTPPVAEKVVGSEAIENEMGSSGRKSRQDQKENNGDQSQPVQKSQVPAETQRNADEVQGEAVPIIEAITGDIPASFSNIVFVLGGPGSGKGTVCSKLSKELEYEHISMGDILRAEVAKDTPQAQQLNDMMKNGVLVPVETTLALLKSEMVKRSKSTSGFLIDGYPREMNQATLFEEKISPCKFVLFFDCSEETMLKRLLKRGETSGRQDDNMETIQKRFQAFQQSSKPVIDYYQSLSKCKTVSSEASPEEVYQATKALFTNGKEQANPQEIEFGQGLQMTFGGAMEESAQVVGEKPQLPSSFEKVVFVLGGPGCGKGTVCERLSKEIHFSHISAGDLLREEVASGSPRGAEIDAMIKEGSIVPVEITLELLEKAMYAKANEVSGFLIDGFPRQMDQAELFESKIIPCRYVLAFECGEEILQKRLLKRGETSGRSDDNEATIRKRFQTFVRLSKPVIDHFAQQNRCRLINAEGSPDEVYQNVLRLFKEEGLVTDIAPSNPPRESLPFEDENIIFVIGGPGSGKGTQCSRIKEALNYAHISTGDLFREEVVKGGEEAETIQNLMKEGKMIPLDLTIRLLLKAMEKERPTSLGFLLDGFPRTVEQAKEFETSIGGCKLVLYYDCPQEVLLQRLSKRGLTSGRADDNEETIKSRIETFVQSTLPVIQYLENAGKVAKIDGSKDIEDITNDTMQCLESLTK